MNAKLYNRKLNALRRAQDVQNYYREVRVEGQSDAWIWRNHIYPRFKISISLFRNYLGVRPENEIRKLEEAQGKQTSLFT